MGCKGGKSGWKYNDMFHSRRYIAFNGWVTEGMCFIVFFVLLFMNLKIRFRVCGLEPWQRRFSHFRMASMQAYKCVNLFYSDLYLPFALNTSLMYI